MKPQRSEKRSNSKQRPEVLAPAGSVDCLQAAVAGGADAVYLGLRHFNARGRADNFKLADLPRYVSYLHDYGVKCYVVFNTLLHDDEIAKALPMAESAARAGVDAAIIQDLGLWRELSQYVPQLARHASTQMSMHHPSQIATLAELGAERVILARELGQRELHQCCREADRLGIEVEHFVHGALCYAFSGQCLISNFAGSRSANRGTCAQNCRFEYRLPDGNINTELSMKDLSLIERVPQLSDMGVASFKIEGRLKGPDFVYTVSRLYRRATEAWAANESFDLSQAKELLREVFSRGSTTTPFDQEYGPAARLHRYAPVRDQQPDATLVSCRRSTGEMIIQTESSSPQAGQGYRFATENYTGGFLIVSAKPHKQQQQKMLKKSQLHKTG